MTGRSELRLTLLDLLLIAGIALGSFWAGQAAVTEYADTIVGVPIPDMAFQIQYGVPAEKDSISSLEDQQKVVSFQLALTQTALEADRINLTHASGSAASSLKVQGSESAALVAQLQGRETGISESLDSENDVLANDEYHAQRSATRSSSLYRLGVWGVEVMGALGMFTILILLLGLLRLRISSGLNGRAVLVGALMVLVILLLTVYAGWVGLMLALVSALSLLVAISRSGSV